MHRVLNQNMGGLNRVVDNENIAAMKPWICLAPNLVSSSGQGDRTVKKRRTDDQEKGLQDHMTKEGGLNSQESMNVPQKNNDGVSASLKPHALRKLSESEVKDMLMTKARMEIQKKLGEWNAKKDDSDEVDGGMKRKKMDDAASNVEKCSTSGLKKTGKMIVEEDDMKSEEHLSTALNLGPRAQVTEFMSMDVPDPEFYDFDNDRIEESFGEDQVWAVYDENDGMPRIYALIHSVSKGPFRVQISWLNAKSSSKLGAMNWIESGFHKTCGDFRAGKCEENNRLNIFSHKVLHWTKGNRGVYQIFPKKGDIWAIYRNWSDDWNITTSLEIIRKYDLVQVVEDYTENVGVRVAPLVKVPGFRSVFRQQQGDVRTIPKQEIFRLSHQVVSYLITGNERANAPEGCLELDPAALPMELLQVIPEAPCDPSTAENADGE